MTIFVLHRGWVVVGKIVNTDDDWRVRIENAYVIRRWGTTKGLGEIAEGGPTTNTILDKTPPMMIPKSAVINTIECNEEAWKSWIF